jgi:hypothetical protein
MFTKMKQMDRIRIVRGSLIKQAGIIEVFIQIDVLLIPMRSRIIQRS